MRRGEFRGVRNFGRGEGWSIKNKNKNRREKRSKYRSLGIGDNRVNLWNCGREFRVTAKISAICRIFYGRQTFLIGSSQNKRNVMECLCGICQMPRMPDFEFHHRILPGILRGLSHPSSPSLLQPHATMKTPLLPKTQLSPMT